MKKQGKNPKKINETEVIYHINDSKKLAISMLTATEKRIDEHGEKFNKELQNIKIRTCQAEEYNNQNKKHTE